MTTRAMSHSHTPLPMLQTLAGLWKLSAVLRSDSSVEFHALAPALPSSCLLSRRDAAAHRYAGLCCLTHTTHTNTELNTMATPHYFIIIAEKVSETHNTHQHWIKHNGNTTLLYQHHIALSTPHCFINTTLLYHHHITLSSPHCFIIIAQKVYYHILHYSFSAYFFTNTGLKASPIPVDCSHMLGLGLNGPFFLGTADQTVPH